MEKLLEMLGLEKLEDSAQKEIKEKLEAIIEVKAKELSVSTLEEDKKTLVKDYEDKFETYKNEMTSKFSDFVDTVFEKELVIPENILEFAAKGQLYHDLVEQFKVRISVDEGLLKDEVKELLKEAKTEIEANRKELNTLIQENLELKADAKEMASSLYLSEKCKGLTEKQRTRVQTILEGITDKEEIDKKFKIVLEEYEEDSDEEDDKKKKKKKDDDEEEVDESKDTDTDEDKNLNEDTEDDNPFKTTVEGKKFAEDLERYKSVLKEGI